MAYYVVIDPETIESTRFSREGEMKLTGLEGIGEKGHIFLGFADRVEDFCAFDSLEQAKILAQSFATELVWSFEPSFDVQVLEIKEDGESVVCAIYTCTEIKPKQTPLDVRINRIASDLALELPINRRAAAVVALVAEAMRHHNPPHGPHYDKLLDLARAALWQYPDRAPVRTPGAHWSKPRRRGP